MSRVLIIGYGNPLRGDDGIGYCATEQLTQSLSSREVEVVFHHQLTPEIAEDIRGRDLVIFIDAGRDGEPGELRFERVAAHPGSGGFSHELSPSTLLYLCQQLYGHSAAAFLVSLCGECFEHGEGLSSRVSASLPHLTELVSQLASAKAPQLKAM